MTQPNPTRALIHRDDLRALTAVITSGGSDPATEETRSALAQEFLDAALELERSLRVHTRDVLMTPRKPLQAGEVEQSAQQLFDALLQYAERIRGFTAGFRPSPYDPPDGNGITYTGIRLVVNEPEHAGRNGWNT